MGSFIARFLGPNGRGAIPNSLDRNINWKLIMKNRALQHQKRVETKGKSLKRFMKLERNVWCKR